MASDAHLRQLRKGVDSWNAWREKNPDIHPNLFEANLSGTDLSGANLSGANLWTAALVDTDLTGADLTGCRIYGVSAWNLKLERAKQQNLIITPVYEAEITVDNIEVAQFIYLLLNNQKIRDVIDTITSKAVEARIVDNKLYVGPGFGGYGEAFIRRLRAMGIRDRPISARSPWQNGLAERVVGSIRRDCLDHVVICGEQHLRHLLSSSKNITTRLVRIYR